jgi:ribosomal protein L27
MGSHFPREQREGRRARKAAQRGVGGQLTDDEYVRAGTVVVDRRGQQWIAMRLVSSARQALWWREVDAETFTPPTEGHGETALDGRRFDSLDQMCGPLVIRSVPRRVLGLF